MSNLFWLTREQLTAIEAAIPMNRRGAKPRRNHEVISGIIDVLKIGCRWEDCPPEYGPHTTVYNRFTRWSDLGEHPVKTRGLRCHGRSTHRHHDRQGPPLRRRTKRRAEVQAIGRSRGGRTAKIHAVADGDRRIVAFELTGSHRGDIRPAPGFVGALPAAISTLGDAAYDNDAFRQFLTDRGTTPVINQNPTRKRFHPFDKNAYRGRNIIERAFSHLKDCRRVATRHDKLASNLTARVILATMLHWWV